MWQTGVPRPPSGDTECSSDDLAIENDRLFATPRGFDAALLGGPAHRADVSLVPFGDGAPVKGEVKKARGSRTLPRAQGFDLTTDYEQEKPMEMLHDLESAGKLLDALIEHPDEGEPVYSSATEWPPWTDAVIVGWGAPLDLEEMLPDGPPFVPSQVDLEEMASWAAEVEEREETLDALERQVYEQAFGINMFFAD